MSELYDFGGVEKCIDGVTVFPSVASANIAVTTKKKSRQDTTACIYHMMNVEN